MANYYIDPIGGNDSTGDGSLGNPWKTLTNGATAARIAAGDEIRVKKSADPVSLGVTGDFTLGSDTVTLSGALTATISDCESAWTASSNVTQSNSNIRCVGNYSQKLDIADAFTTGKIAYFDFGAGNEKDLSGYTGVSFCMGTSAAKAGSMFRIDLCSDAAGDTPVDQFTITMGLGRGWGDLNTKGNWNRFNLWKGSALGSSIRSISIHALSDPGTVSIYLDAVIAINYLSHNCLIGDGSGKWFQVATVDGTTVKLNAAVWDLSADGNSLQCVYDHYPNENYCTGYSTALMTIQDSGSAGSCIKYRFGWNFSSDAQDGYTNFNSWTSDGGQAIYNNGKSYTRFENVRLLNAWRLFSFTGASQGIELKNVEAYGLGDPVYFDSGQNAYFGSIEGDNYFVSNGHNAYLPGRDVTWTGNIYGHGTNVHIFDNNVSGWGTGIVITGTVECASSSSAVTPDVMAHAWLRNVIVHTCMLGISGPYNVIVETLEQKAANPSYIGRAYVSDIGGAGSVTIDNYIYSGTLGVALWYAEYQGALSEWNCLALNGDPTRYCGCGKNANWGDHVSMGQAAGWGYGGSGSSLVVSPTRTTLKHRKFLLAPVVSGETYKFTAQVKKTSSGANCTLNISVSGCGITAVRNESVTLTDSWTLYESTSFTPSASGYVRIVLEFMDGSTTGDIGLDAMKVAKQ